MVTTPYDEAMKKCQKEYEKICMVAKYCGSKIKLTDDNNMYYIYIILIDTSDSYKFDVYDKEGEIILYFKDMNDKLKELIKDRLFEVYDSLENRLGNRANYLIDILENYNQRK